MTSSEIYIFHVVGLALLAFSVGYCFKSSFCPNDETAIIEAIGDDIDALESRMNQQQRAQRRLNETLGNFQPVVATAVEPSAPPRSPLHLPPIYVNAERPGTPIQREYRRRGQPPTPAPLSNRFEHTYSTDDDSSEGVSSPARIRRVNSNINNV
jgi:hypothetical protein